jgi:hypothetical protein
MSIGSWANSCLVCFYGNQWSIGHQPSVSIGGGFWFEFVWFVHPLFSCLHSKYFLTWRMHLGPYLSSAECLRVFLHSRQSWIPGIRSRLHVRSLLLPLSFDVDSQPNFLGFFHKIVICKILKMFGPSPSSIQRSLTTSILASISSHYKSISDQSNTETKKCHRLANVPLIIFKDSLSKFLFKFIIKNAEKSSRDPCKWSRRDGVCDFRGCPEKSRRRDLLIGALLEFSEFLRFIYRLRPKWLVYWERDR